MFESVVAVPLHFTIEFLGFLMAVAGAVVVLSRPILVPGRLSNRLPVALGFLVLAGAQVLHGGAFFPHEGEPALVGLRALAYALLLVGISGALKPGAAVFAGFEIKEPLLFAPAGAAFLLAASAFSAARAASIPMARRLAVGALLLGLSEVLTSAAPRFEVGEFDRFAYAAHGVKALAFLMVGGWIWAAVRSSIRTRFVASFGMLLVAVILVLSTALTAVISSDVQSNALERIRAQAVNAANTQFQQRGSLNEEVETISGLRSVRRDIVRRENLNALARGILQLQIGGQRDFVVVDPFRGVPGVAGARARRKPGKPPRLRPLDVVDILGTPVVKEVLDGSPSSANVVRIGDSVALIASSRINALNGRPAGVLTIGRYMDVLTVEEIAATVDAPASLVVGGTVFASTLPLRHARELVVPDEANLSLGVDGSAAEVQRLSNAGYFSGFAYIRGPSVGTLVISSPVRGLTQSRQEATTLLFLATMLVGAVALVLAWLSGRRITRPIQELTATASAVREGDLTAEAKVEGDDEVGQLGDTFNEMTASLLKMTNDLRTAAREEYTLRARIETIMQSMADGLIAVGPDHKILAYNREAENLTGVPVDEAVDRPLDEVLSVLDANGASINLPVHSLAEGSTGGVFVRKRDADPVPVAVTSAVLRGEDEVVAGAVAVLRDMTREREIERMKTEFLSNISHELRTPLTPIKGYAEILGRKDLPAAKVQHFSRGILDSTARLERIVELLVDFSAMEAGRMAPRVSEVDLAEMLERLADEWRAKSSKHEVVADLEATELGVIGDERLLRRSLEEVLDNAFKFSPSGGTIRLEAKEAFGRNGGGDHRTVEVTVADPGIGISPDDLPRIFSDFHQLDGSETRPYGGLGLGLAFVQRIVEAHSGVVEVESEPEGGTRLTIALPAASRAKVPEAAKEE